MRYIREWSLEDAPDIAMVLNNRKIHDNLRDGLPYPYTESDACDYITGVLSAPQGSQFCWAILYKCKAAGSIGMFRKDNIYRRSAELGYWLAEPCWGMGITTGSVREACDRVFNRTDILRIYAEPFARNTASCRVLEKAGFTCEGTLRSNAVKNGKVVDMKLYARVRQEQEAWI